MSASLAAAEASVAFARPDSNRSSTELPPGVHRSGDGRYVKDFCDGSRGRFRCGARWTLPESWQPGDPVPTFGEGVVPQATPPAGMSPTDVQKAYNLPDAAAANGKIVAIIDSPDNHAYTDLSSYRSTYGLPTLPQCSGLPTGTTPCFAQVAEDGGVSSGTDPSTNDDGETSLDMDMISAACPDCSILLVEINSLCGTDILNGVATATKLGASAISISLGGPEATDPNALDFDAGPPTDGGNSCPAEATWTNDPAGPYSSPGHLVFVAAGDFGYNNVNFPLNGTGGGPHGDSPSSPSSSPYVVAVGGTALYSLSGSYGEGVWNDGTFSDSAGTLGGISGQDVTTSGCSTEFSMPPWQASELAGTGCEKRATADVAAAAEFFTGTTKQGIVICLTELSFLGPSCTGGVEGTSAASPLMAAIFTRLGLTTEASNDLSWIYSHASAFNDVGATSGYPLPSGGSLTDAPPDASCGKLCTAGPGWDGPTGVGSPNGGNLAALPVSTSGPVAYPDAGLNCVTALSDAGCGSSGTPPIGDAASPTTDATVGGDAGHGGGTDGGQDASVSPSGGSDGGTVTSSSDGSSGSDDGTDAGAPVNKGGSGCATAPGATDGFGGLGALLGLTLLISRRGRSAR